jgi:hypothetical protein
MLTFPDLGLVGRGSPRLTQILRMSVELDNVPGNQKPVNTFLRNYAFDKPMRFVCGPELYCFRGGTLK